MRSPRAAMIADTASGIPPNRSARLGPLAPGEMKFQVRHKCRTTGRDAKESRSRKRLDAEWMPAFRSSKAWPPAYVPAMPFLGLSTGLFVLVNSPARRFPAARCGPACRACSRDVCYFSSKNQADRCHLSDQLKDARLPLAQCTECSQPGKAVSTTERPYFSGGCSLIRCAFRFGRGGHAINILIISMLHGNRKATVPTGRSYHL
jgi:hypothetical protein